MEKTVFLMIRCFDSCTYEVVYPQFFIDCTIPNLRKLFRWLFQFDYYEENRETIDYLADNLPLLAAEAQKKSEECKAAYDADRHSAEKKEASKKAESDYKQILKIRDLFFRRAVGLRR